MVEKRSFEGRQSPGEEQVLKKLCRGLGIQEEEVSEEGVINSLLLSGEADEDDEVLVIGSGDDDVREELLSGVIKSLEDEINFSSSGTSTPGNEAEEPPCLHHLQEPRVDFSYLMEASDDELGIVSCSSPALSEADLVSPGVMAMKPGLLELLNGEVINLDFPELGEIGEVEDQPGWLRQAVATLDMVTEVIGSGGGHEFESLEQVLVEPPGL